MKYIKSFIFFCAICISCLSAHGEVPLHQSTIASPMNAQWWQKTQQEINEDVANSKVDLLFVGDSITHWFKKMSWHNESTCGMNVWRDYYAKRNAVNTGIMADKTQNVLWRLQNGNLKGIHPKLAVIMIGTNNVSHKETPLQTADGIRAIIECIHGRCPDTKVLLLAIFPRGKTIDDKARAQNDKVNEIISKYDQLYSFLSFLDISKAFLKDDGSLNQGLLPDHLHPNAKGYQVWAEAMEPSIKKLLNE
jgi:beta-glucosidase